MPTYNVTETLNLLHKTNGRENKKNILKERECFALKALLQLNFHPDVTWAIPKGEPPYEPAKKGTIQSNSLHYEVKKLNYFIDSNSKLPQLKREAMFVNLLERIEPDDAQLLLDVKDKKLNRTGLTYSLVREVWPDLLPELSEAELSDDSVEETAPKTSEVKEVKETKKSASRKKSSPVSEDQTV